MKRLLSISLLAVFLVAFGSAVWAQSLDGGCTVSATSDLDSTTMLDATREDPFEIDPDGTISWNATSTQPITNHTWVIYSDVGGFGVPVARGGEPNTAGTLTSIGTRSIPEELAEAQAEGVPNARLLGSMRGIYRVYGDISGSSSCSGEAYVLLRGNPLTELVGQVALAIAVLGALLVVGGGVAKSPR